jgi:hypothetical protein
MTLTARIWHLVHWELIRLRGWLSVFAAACALAVVAVVTEQFGTAGVLPMLIFAIGAFTAANIMVNDSPLLATSHGVGKPLDRLALVVAKVLLVAICFLVIPLALQWVVEVAMGVPSDHAFADLRLSDVLVRGWLFVAMAVGAASQSMRSIVSTTLVLLLLAAGGSLLMYQGWTFGWHASGVFPAVVVSAISTVALWTPLGIVAWLYLRRPSRAGARASIAALVLVRLVALICGLLIEQDPSRLESVSGVFVSDSVVVTDSTHVRLVYHINGQTDTAGLVPDFQTALATVVGARTDTLYLFAQVAPGEPTPSQPTFNTESFDPRTGSRRSLRSKMTSRGVVVWQSTKRINADAAELRLSLTGARYRRRVLGRAPWTYGTLIDRDGRRVVLAMDSSTGRTPRPTIAVRDITAGVSLFGRGSMSPLDHLEFTVDAPAVPCCTPVRVDFSQTEDGGVIYPAVRRTREVAPVDWQGSDLVEVGSQVAIREWRLRDVVVMKVTVPLPASADANRAVSSR